MVLVIVAIAKDGRMRTIAVGGAIAFGLAAGVFAVSIGQMAVALRDFDFHDGLGRRTRLMEVGVDSEAAFPLDGGAYFFLRTTGFSPDPYCGYEYAPMPELLVLDPLGSGQGEANALDLDGWYWICAS